MTRNLLISIVVGLHGVALFSCFSRQVTGKTGETHFLSYCQESCTGNLDCLEGVCTLECSRNSDCVELGKEAFCIAHPQSESDGPNTFKYCDRSCAKASDCAGLGATVFQCIKGLCRADSRSDFSDSGVGDQFAIWTDSKSGFQWQDPPHQVTMDWQDAVEYCDTLSFDGQDDWRLPNIQELLSLVQGCDQNDCALSDPDCLYKSDNLGCDMDCNFCTPGEGPGPSGCYWDPALSGWCTEGSIAGGCGSYWSSSTLPDDDGVWRVMFCTGSVDLTSPETDDDGPIHIRCVRGTRIDDPSATDFGGTECSGGIYDANTDLCWLYPPEQSQSYRWDKAIAYCDDLSLDGNDEWRLPNIEELRTLVRGCPETETDGACSVTDGGDSSQWTESCAGCAWLDGPGKGGCYWEEQWGYYCDEVGFWSSSYQSDLTYNVWTINFSDGEISMLDTEDFYSGAYILCVHDGI